MQDETRKETLTRKQIKKELKYISFCNILFRIVPAAIITPIILYLFPDDRFFPFAILFSIVVLIFICESCYFLKLFIVAHNNTFSIIVDKLSNTKDIEFRDGVTDPYIGDAKFAIIPLSFNLLGKTFRLFFSKNRVWRIPSGCIYTWSKYNWMNSFSVFRSSNIGDEFYLVMVGKKIILAYNTKFFELQD